MSVPSVNMNELDGGLGISRMFGGGVPMLIGTSSAGVAATPAIYTRASDVIAAFGAGPLVEAAALWCNAGLACVCCKIGTANQGGYGGVDNTRMAGTCDLSADTNLKPYDEYDIKVLFVAGGTVTSASPAITYRYSLDGGESYSQIQSLGVATSITIAEGNIKLSLSGGSIVAGDYATCRTTPPEGDGTTSPAALAAAAKTTLAWEYAMFLPVVDAFVFDLLAAWMAALDVAEQDKWCVVGARGPAVGESNSAWQASLIANFTGHTSTKVLRGAGYCVLPSGVTAGRKFRRPSAWATALRISFLPVGQDAAEVDLGGLSSLGLRAGAPTDIRIADANGNPVEHDERVYPGLDDAGFCTLRTWVGEDGVFINNPRMASAAGSDFEFAQHRRVMNAAKQPLRSYLRRRLSSRALRVSGRTGFILESEAKSVETGGNAELRQAILSRPDASAAVFSVSRNDNILSTKTVTYTIRITPLAYPKTITGTISFVNPALQVV